MSKTLKQKFQELRTKHRVAFPQICDNSVYFTISDPDEPPYSRKNTIRFMYVYDPIGGWGLVLGNETEKSKAYMDDLLSEGIITSDGKANYTYPEYQKWKNEQAGVV